MEGKERSHQCFKKVQLIWKYNLFVILFLYLEYLSFHGCRFQQLLCCLRDAPHKCTRTALSQHRAKGKAGSKPSQPGTGATGPPVAVGLTLDAIKTISLKFFKRATMSPDLGMLFLISPQKITSKREGIGHLILHPCSTVSACALLHFSPLCGQRLTCFTVHPRGVGNISTPKEPLPCLQHPDCSTWRF